MAKKENKTINKKEKNNKDKTSFFKGFKAELKKVNWPTPKQLVNNTSAVIVIVLVLAVIVFVLDFVFESANKYGLDKIKESVTSSTQENSSSEETETTDNTESEGTTETTEGTESSESGEATETTDSTETTDNTDESTSQN